jgi:hypothetical protein
MALSTDDYLKNLARAKSGIATTTFGNNGVGNGAASRASDDRARTDLAYNTSEIAKAEGILKNRTAAGLDTSSQMAYLKKLNEYRNALNSAGINATGATGAGVAGNGTDTITNANITASAGQSSTNYINALNEARRNKAIAELTKSRDSALSNLTAEKAGIQPRYYDARNQVASGSQQGARSFAEFMANRGGTRSGAAAQAELSRIGALQGNLGSLGRQETQALDDNARRVSDVQNAYASDLASAQAGIEADKMSALLNQYNADRSYGLDVAGLTGILNGQQTLAAREADRNYGLNLGQLTGTFNGQRTLAGQQFDYGKQTDQRNFDYQKGVDQRNFDFQKGQQEWDNNFRQGQFDWQKAQQAWENAFKEKDFDQQIKQFASQMGYNWASLNQRQQEALADQAFRNKSFQLQQDQFDYSKDPNNPDNIYKLAEIDKLKNSSSSSGSTLSDKDSTDNYNGLYDDFNSPELTATAKQLGLSEKELARNLLGQNKSFLSDSDYSKLSNWINENL